MSLNMHAIVRGAVTAVNQDIIAQFQASLGNTTNADYSQTPQYALPVPVRIQSQPLTSGQIRHMDALNLQGVFRSVYLYGLAQGIVRVTQEGGDLLSFALRPNTPQRLWKVVEVVEIYPDWAHVIVAMQTDAPVTP